MFVQAMAAEEEAKNESRSTNTAFNSKPKKTDISSWLAVAERGPRPFYLN
jgi:hypothetical protein